MGEALVQANTLLLIGGNLCIRTAHALDPQHWACIGLRRRPMNIPPDDDRIHWLQADLNRADTLARALASPTAPGVITHLLYAPAPDVRTPEAYACAYPHGLQTLLAALPGTDQLQRGILVDSTAVWGPDTADQEVNEDTPTCPEDFRGEAMLQAEALLQARLPGRGAALRLSGLYGPGRLRLVDGLRAGRITAPDGPGHWANRIHIDDAARACAHLLSLTALLPCYIGTDDHPLPTTVLYDTLAQIAGGPIPARADRPPDGRRLSNARLRASGWVPRWSSAIDGYVASLDAGPPHRIHSPPCQTRHPPSN